MVCSLCIKTYTAEHAYCVIKMTNYLLGHQVSQDTLAPSHRGCVLWEWHLIISKSIPRISILWRQRWIRFHHSFVFFVALLNTEGCIKQANKSGYLQKQPTDSKTEKHNLNIIPQEMCFYTKTSSNLVPPWFWNCAQYFTHCKMTFICIWNIYNTSIFSYY